MKLIYSRQQGAGVVHNGTVQWSITTAPDLAFEYDGIFFNDERREYKHLRANGQSVLTDAEQAAVVSWVGQQTAPPPPEESAAEIQQQIVQAVQDHLDTTARTRNYDGILSLCSYATSSNTTFAAEGQAGVEWRDAVWAYCYQVLADVQAQTRTIPTPAELIAELPTIDW